MKFKTVLIAVYCAVCVACAPEPDTTANQSPQPIPEAKSISVENPLVLQTTDGVQVFGDVHFADLPNNAPLIMLFHQGGSNGRAEYGPLIPWLNENGFRVVAWDQRSGGQLYGGNNRTKDALAENVPKGYCDAYPDLEIALTTTIERGLAEEVFVWGSSYSGALVFQLAAKNPDKVKGVLAFSPASGKPLANCLAGAWVDQVKAPMLVYSPRSEMDRETTQEQKTLMDTYGVSYFITEKGIHGSSMLVDERTENDMSEARAQTIKWLKEHS